MTAHYVESKNIKFTLKLVQAGRVRFLRVNDAETVSSSQSSVDPKIFEKDVQKLIEVLAMDFASKQKQHKDGNDME